MDSLTATVPARLEDEIQGHLWAMGSEGGFSEALADGRLRLHAFFLPGQLRAESLARLAAIDPEIELGPPEPVVPRDWSAAWRAGAQPIPVGRGFLVDPREPEEVAGPIDGGGRIVLRLPARTAFGVGSHESTRLAVELLETVDLRQRSVLDVGAGTGILGFVALALGARRVVAFDVDPGAALLLPQYMRMNSRRLLAFAGSVEALGCGESLPGPARGAFDCALVNVVPSEIESGLPRLVSLLARGAEALFSGILAGEADVALSRLATAGFVERARRVDGEWVAFRMSLATIRRAAGGESWS